MENLKILPYNMGSEAARDLARILNVVRVRPEGSNYIPKMGHTIVNFGSSNSPNWAPIASRRGNRILNKPENVANAANKLSAFRILEGAGIRVPNFTTSMTEAQLWLRTGNTVVERHKLSSHSGEGIRIVDRGDVITAAPLYTKYYYKQAEFRVHVFRGQVIDYIQKKKRNGAEDMPNFDRFVYSAERGWVFVRESATQIDSVKTIAMRAVSALGLDFGAVDVMLVDNVPYVLEVNTAPGLTGTTLIKYANAFRQFMGAGPLDAGTVNNYRTTLRGRELEDVDTAARVAPAAYVAQDRGYGESITPPRRQMTAAVDGDMVTLRLDRATARTLKDLLSTVL